MVKKTKKNAGFSLIEVLFAMLFLSVIIFGVIKLQTSNLILSNTRQQELRAHTYAAEGLEIVGALGYDALIACLDDNCYIKKDSGTYSLVGQSEGPEILEKGLFERYVQHSQSELTGDATLVTVYVEWNDSSGDDHSVSASRVIFKQT